MKNISINVIIKTAPKKKKNTVVHTEIKQSVKQIKRKQKLLQRQNFVL